MKNLLRTTFFSALLCGMFMMPAVSSAHQTLAMRPDGISFQAAYSMKGHWMFVNRISKRHMRHTVIEVMQPIVLPKEII